LFIMTIKSLTQIPFFPAWQGLVPFLWHWYFIRPGKIMVFLVLVRYCDSAGSWHRKWWAEFPSMRKCKEIMQKLSFYAYYSEKSCVRITLKFDSAPLPPKACQHKFLPTPLVLYLCFSIIKVLFFKFKDK